MKKMFYLVSVLLLVFMLTACGSNDTDATTDSSSDSTSTTFEMSTETKLLIGILKLDGTEQEVDAEQAAELLPLWQLYQSLSTSDTAAQEEIDSVVKSIEKAMSIDQLDTIEAMDLNPKDMFTIMQDLGLAPAPQVDASGTPMPNMMMPPQDFNSGQRPEGFSGGEPPAGFSGGQPPDGFIGRQQGQGGGPSGDGFVPGEDGQGLSPDAIATAQASGAPMRARQMRVSSMMLNAVIEYLQQKAEL